MKPSLAQRMSKLTRSPVRDILHLLEKPGMISFAGGLPSEDSFPTLNTMNVPPGVLQYGPSEGDSYMRQWVVEDLARQGLEVCQEQVLILSGSQQGIDLVTKMVVDNGTRIAVESPTYLAALQAFTLFGADYLPFNDVDDPALTDQDYALAYLVPSFQNPTGKLYSNQARDTLARRFDAKQCIVFEDDPYRDLYFEKKFKPAPPVCSRLTQCEWVYQSSFSKTLAPGLRLAYLACSPGLQPHLVKLKQAADLHSNRLSQFLVHALVNDSEHQSRQTNLRNNYRQKRDLFEELLQSHLAPFADWETPNGGLFFWLTLKTETPVDTRLLLQKALEQDVAFMPGEPFYPVPVEAANTIRLNFSLTSPAQAKKGLKTLAALLEQTLDTPAIRSEAVASRST